ncbi:MAG: hypothetical protein II087_01170, partial [Muribaculaceae bacterium]|nr:hypothetical protein [Muribaculaceae bacterium]
MDSDQQFKNIWITNAGLADAYNAKRSSLKCLLGFFKKNGRVGGQTSLPAEKNFLFLQPFGVFNRFIYEGTFKDKGVSHETDIKRSIHKICRQGFCGS